MVGLSSNRNLRFETQDPARFPVDGRAVCKEWQLDCTRVTEDVQRCTQGTGVAQPDRCVELMLLERAHKLVVLCSRCVPAVLMYICALHILAAEPGCTTMQNVGMNPHQKDRDTKPSTGWCLSVAASAQMVTLLETAVASPGQEQQGLFQGLPSAET